MSFALQQAGLASFTSTVAVDLPAHGESGNDRIFGGPGDDLLIGGPGNDYIKTGGGYDTVRGGPGNDFIDATGKGLAKVDCGSGDDTVIAKRLEHLYRCEHVRFAG